ncbi:MAG: uroporphyrinogen-III C-methyltransferase [Synechococcales cyanobacterium]
MTGIVYLVGAGLGDPQFLTQQALSVLSTADVIVADELVDVALLAGIPTQAQWLTKPPSRSSLDELHHLLIEHCRAGKRVVHLKSGDPWIFGRTQETLTALAQAHCPVEVIPGLSSALGAAWSAGIPLTLKGISQSVGLISGHDLDGLNIPALAGLDTLVVLMGGGTLPQLAQGLCAAGRDPQTPVAVIAAAGRPSQTVTVGTLADLPALPPSTPLLAVVGQVIAHRRPPAPPLPLSGQTVLVTRADTPVQNLRSRLLEVGATVLDMPTLEIVPPSSWDPLDHALAHLTTWDWLILTSGNAVTFLMERLRHHRLDSRALAGMRIAVVGDKTADVLGRYGVVADVMPTEFVAEALAPLLQVQAGIQVLFPRVESGGRDDLTQSLRQAGASVTEVPAYESRCPLTGDPAVWEALRQGQIQIITFTSSKTVQHFAHLLNQAGIPPAALDGVQLAVIGPKTAATCRERLGRVDVQAQPYTLDGLVTALVDARRL